MKYGKALKVQKTLTFLAMVGKAAAAINAYEGLGYHRGLRLKRNPRYKR